MDAAAQLAYRPDIGVSIAGVLPKRVETTREQPAARRKCVTCFKCFRQAGRRGHAGPSVTIAASVSAASRRAGSPDVALCPLRVAHLRWQRGNEPSAPPRGTSSAILISNATPIPMGALSIVRLPVRCCVSGTRSGSGSGCPTNWPKALPAPFASRHARRLRGDTVCIDGPICVVA